MLGHLIRKEIAIRLLDARFVVVFGLCAFLALLSVYVGAQNHLWQQREYDDAVAARQVEMDKWIEKDYVRSLAYGGFSWNRPPQALGILIQGISGETGREATVRFTEDRFHAPIPNFESSPFEANPAIPLFGVLDLAFVVEIVLSLSVLLFTFDAVCGEKEGGTLRLCASFPIARSTLALSKLLGAMFSTLAPFGLAFLLGATVLVLMPDVDLASDVARIAALGFSFALYLAVFVAFGVWMSSLVQNRVLAFLLLLGIWTSWIFVIPNAGFQLARRLTPVQPLHTLELAAERSRWELGQEDARERQTYWIENYRDTVDLPDGSSVVRRWEDLDEAEKVDASRVRWTPATHEIRGDWLRRYRERILADLSKRRNEIQRRNAALDLASLASPLGALRLVATDLARTGRVQEARTRESFLDYRPYFLDFMWARIHLPGEDRELSDFSPLTYRDSDTAGDVLVRNLFPVTVICLLVVLGVAGTCATILRYDVR